jgi:hypothetical protein
LGRGKTPQPNVFNSWINDGILYLEGRQWPCFSSKEDLAVSICSPWPLCEDLQKPLFQRQWKLAKHTTREVEEVGAKVNPWSFGASPS